LNQILNVLQGTQSLFNGTSRVQHEGGDRRSNGTYAQMQESRVPVCYLSLELVIKPSNRFILSSCHNHTYTQTHRLVLIVLCFNFSLLSTSDSRFPD